jgi:hypothetical protein
MNMDLPPMEGSSSNPEEARAARENWEKRKSKMEDIVEKYENHLAAPDGMVPGAGEAENDRREVDAFLKESEENDKDFIEYMRSKVLDLEWQQKHPNLVKRFNI